MKKITLICMLLFLLTGCTNNSTKELYQFDNIPKLQNESQILLYDRPHGKIISYNTASKKIAMQSTSKKYRQFGFINFNINLYTSGDYNASAFRILEIVDNKISVLYETEEGVGLTPFAYKDSKTSYFTKHTKSDKSKKDYDLRVICKFDSETKQLEELDLKDPSSISNGVIIDDYLYYTKDSTLDDGWYELYRIDTTNPKTEELLIDKVPEGNIFNNNGKLCVSDEEYIYDYKDETKKYKNLDQNYFYDNMLYQISFISSNDSTLTITDLETSESLAPFHNVIDFKVDGDIVTIYQKEDIATYNLKSKK